jgi:hypothetical protein
MVKLRRFYEAKQVGDIYHFCTLQVAVKYIIPNDTLSPSGKWTNSLIGSSNVLSFTRDKRFIVDLLSYEKILVRFDVDGNKLSENHKIFPYNDIDTSVYGGDLEKEEVVVGKITNFSKYIKSISIILNKPLNSTDILFQKNYLKSALNSIITYAEEHSIPLEIDAELKKNILD